MNTYAPALVKEIKRSKGIMGFIISRRSDACYYYGENPAEDVCAMWIEVYQLGKTIAYPCMLKIKDDLMLYKNGKEYASSNNQLMTAWNAYMKPSDFGSFKYQKLSQDDFADKLDEYKTSKTEESTDEQI
jgi:hypothetical protein